MVVHKTFLANTVALLSYFPLVKTYCEISNFGRPHDHNHVNVVGVGSFTVKNPTAGNIITLFIISNMVLGQTEFVLLICIFI